MSLPPHTVRRTRATVALFAVLAVGAAACSEDGDDAVTTTAAPVTTAAATTVAPSGETPSEGGGDSASGGATTTYPLPLGDVVATALTNQVFTQLAGMVVDAGLVEALRAADPGFTVFAPTDEAFDKLPVPLLHSVQDIDSDGDDTPDLLAPTLLHHVINQVISPDDLVPGEYESMAGTVLTVTEVDDQMYVNGAPIGIGVEASNGWVYVMGDVLVPPVATIADTATTFTCCFATLVSLVVEAELVEGLSGDDELTVFAPIDSAFEKLPEATLTAVSRDVDLLTTVLTHHVVAGKFNLDQLTDGQVLTTLAGTELVVTIVNGQVLIDGFPVAVGNVQATNGVIHVMGDVLIPET